MKLFILVVLLAVVVVLLTVLPSCRGRAPMVQLIDGKLRLCPGTPNCVSSESNGEAFRVAPFAFTDTPDAAWARVRQTVVDTGGTIQSDDGEYLWATYTSRLFRFVDDLELRMDRQGGVLQVRSASRVGRSDLGVNRKRVEMIRERFGP